MSAPNRRARLDMRHKKVSVRRQCALLGLARSGVCRAPAGEDDAAAMRRIDALYTEHPFYGSRRIAFTLKMNRKRPSSVSRVPRYYEGATTSHSVSASAYVFRSRSPRLTSSFVSAFRALPPIGGLRRAWSSGQPGDPFPVLRLRGRFGTSQVRSAILPAPLPSSQDPGRTDETSPLAVPSAPPPRTGKRRLRQGRIFRG